MTKPKFASDVFKISEKDFREEIRDLSKLFGWKFWFCWTSIHSPRGMPDLILLRPPLDEATKAMLSNFQKKHYGKEVSVPDRPLPELESLTEIDKIMRELPHYERIKI